MSDEKGQHDPQTAGADPAPQVNSLYTVPGYSALHPEIINQSTKEEDVILNWGGMKIVKLSPTTVTAIEAESMILLLRTQLRFPFQKSSCITTMAQLTGTSRITGVYSTPKFS